MEALLVGYSTSLSWAIPYVLSRAGFTVDVVTAASVLRFSRFTREVHVVRPGASVAASVLEHVRSRSRPYDWVIAADDDTLAALVALKSQGGASLLPVTRDDAIAHLASKIGLSHVLSACGIKTPPSAAARDCEEALSAANAFGYPVMLKLDLSCGGLGTHECAGPADIMALRRLFASGPLLVQKKIAGAELDLSAIFLGGQLVHFTYSSIERTMRRFGPSSVRRFFPSPLVPEAVFDELAALGRALGGHGFATISCIDAADGSGRYYFEADMRPSVWADFSLFYGEDAALRIRDWFSHRARMTKANAAPDNREATPLTIPYFLSLPTLELLANRYAAWKYIPFADKRVAQRLLAAKLLSGCRAVGRRMLSRRVKSAWRGWLRTAGLLVD